MPYMYNGWNSTLMDNNVEEGNIEHPARRGRGGAVTYNRRGYNTLNHPHRIRPPHLTVRQSRYDTYALQPDQQQQQPSNIQISPENDHINEPQKPIVLLTKTHNLPTTINETNTDHAEPIKQRQQIQLADDNNLLLDKEQSPEASYKPDYILGGTDSANGNCPRKIQTAKTCSDEVVQSPTKTKSLMPPPVGYAPKLITESMEFSDAILRHLSDRNSHYRVIACVGYHGVGKSTIMCQLSNDDDAFPVASVESETRLMHMTQGIDIYVTQNRTILLDAQPIFSASVFNELLLGEKTQQQQQQHHHQNNHHQLQPPLHYMTPTTTDYLGQILKADSNLVVNSLQIMAFLLAVSHTVVFIDDWNLDYDLVSLFRAAEMLKPATPLSPPNSTTTNGNNKGEDEATNSRCESRHQEYYPHFVVVHNRCTSHQMLEKSQQDIRTVYAMQMNGTRLKFWDAVQNESHEKKRSIQNSNSGTQNTTITDINKLNNTPTKTEETGRKSKLAPDAAKCPDNVNVYFLPSCDKKQYADDYEKRWKGQIKLFAEKLTQIRNEPLLPVALTEKQWFQYAHKVWEATRKSSAFVDYERLLQLYDV